MCEEDCWPPTIRQYGGWALILISWVIRDFYFGWDNSRGEFLVFVYLSNDSFTYVCAKTEQVANKLFNFGGSHVRYCHLNL